MMEESKEKQCEEMESFIDDDEVKYGGGSKILQKSVRLIALTDIAAALILMVGSLYLCATIDREMEVSASPKGRRPANYDDDFWLLPDVEISGTQMIMGAVIASQMTQMIFALCLLTGANYRMRDNCEPWVGLQCLILIITLLILVFIGGLLVEAMPILMIVLIMSCFYKSVCILIVGKFVGQLEKLPESKKLIDTEDEYGMNDFII